MEYTGVIKPTDNESDLFLATDSAMAELQRVAAKHNVSIDSLKIGKLEVLLKESGLRVKPIPAGGAKIYSLHDEVEEAQTNRNLVFERENLGDGFQLEGQDDEEAVDLTPEELGVPSYLRRSDERG